MKKHNTLTTTTRDNFNQIFRKTFRNNKTYDMIQVKKNNISTLTFELTKNRIYNNKLWNFKTSTMKKKIKEIFFFSIDSHSHTHNDDDYIFEYFLLAIILFSRRLFVWIRLNESNNWLVYKTYTQRRSKFEKMFFESKPTFFFSLNYGFGPVFCWKKIFILVTFEWWWLSTRKISLCVCVTG